MPCGAARGGRCESDPGGQGSCREIEGRLHTSKGRPAEDAGWSVGAAPHFRGVQGKHSLRFWSLPGFRSQVCPLLTVCPWAGDCLPAWTALRSMWTMAVPMAPSPWVWGAERDRGRGHLGPSER